jgi:hypothetical protein
MAYTNNVPQSTQTIASTQGPISANFTFLQSAIGQEHNFNVGDPAQTYHKLASMPNTGGTPAKPAGTNGVYYVDGGEALFLNNSGSVSQLTKGTASVNGSQWIGKVLLLWGSVIQDFSNGATTGTVTFPSSGFPTACFSVQATPLYAPVGTSPVPDPPSGSANGVASIGSISKTTFKWSFNTSSGNYHGFYWMAVGN